MKKTQVRVVARLRPVLKKEVQQTPVVHVKENVVEMLTGTTRQHYSFDAAYDEKDDQTTVFKEMEPFIESVFRGINSSIMCYGVTGSGKTYTMEGTKESPGLVLLTGKDILRRIGDDKSIQMRMSMYEIYLGDLTDLLSNGATLRILTDRKDNISIKNLTEVPVSDYNKFRELYRRAIRTRKVNPTSLNEKSSRSHVILQLKVTKTEETTNKTVTKTGKIQLLDLAGSENNNLTGNKGQRMNESKHINLGLSYLHAVIDNILKGAFVVYRNSALTRVLQDSLGGKACAMLIVQVSPLKMQLMSTQATLEYGMKSKSIINSPVVNVQENVQQTKSASSKRRLEELKKWKDKKKRTSKPAKSFTSKRSPTTTSGLRTPTSMLSRLSTRPSNSSNSKSSRTRTSPSTNSSNHEFKKPMAVSTPKASQDTNVATPPGTPIEKKMARMQAQNVKRLNEIAQEQQQLYEQKLAEQQKQNDEKLAVLVQQATLIQQAALVQQAKEDRRTSKRRKSSVVTPQNKKRKNEIKYTPKTAKSISMLKEAKQLKKKMDFGGAVMKYEAVLQEGLLSGKGDSEQHIREKLRKCKKKQERHEKENSQPSKKRKVKSEEEEQQQKEEPTKMNHIDEQVQLILDILNRGTERQLKNLQMIGRVKCNKIMAARENNVQFKQKEDLKSIGFSGKSLERFFQMNNDVKIFCG